MILTILLSLLAQTTPAQPAADDARTVKIVEAKLEAAVSTKAPEIAFTVENQGKAAVEKVTILATLANAAGTAQRVDVVPAQIAKLDPGQQQVVFLKPQLEKDGKYTGVVRLRYLDQTSDSMPVEITRTTPATAEPAITVEDALGSKLDLDPFKAKSAKVVFNVTETGGAKQTLTPHLKSFAQKLDGDKKIAAVGKLHDEKPIPIGAKESKDVAVQIDGIERAGEYIASVVFEKGTFRTQPKTATVYARESWLIAALLIAIGVFASFALRVYYKYTRPRLITENQVARIQQTLGELAAAAAADADAARVVKRFQDHVGDRWNTLGRMDRAVGSPEVTLWEDQLQLLDTWLKLRKLSARVPEALRKDYNTAMSAAEQVLDRTAATSQNVSDARDALEKLIAPITAVQTKGVTDTTDIVFGRVRTWEELKGRDRAIYRRLWLIDRAAVWIALIVAIFIGIKTVWATDLTWGGWVDHLAALVWGFGLHQLTAAGVGSVLAEVRKALD